MKYNVDYFLDFFGKKEKWINGKLHEEHNIDGGVKWSGAHCALGHLRLEKEADADKHQAAIALAGMIADHLEKEYEVNFEVAADREPSCLIPTINDGEAFLGIIDNGGEYTSFDTKQLGTTPKKRIMRLLKEIKAKCVRNKESKTKKEILETR